MFNVEVTEKAAEKIKDIMKKEGNPQLALRLYVAQGTGCQGGLRYGIAFDDRQNKGDMVVQTNGVKILVDDFSADYLDGCKIDYVTSLMGSGFHIDNPNAAESCECGTFIPKKQGIQISGTLGACR